MTVGPLRKRPSPARRITYSPGLAPSRGNSPVFALRLATMSNPPPYRPNSPPPPSGAPAGTPPPPAAGDPPPGPPAPRLPAPALWFTQAQRAEAVTRLRSRFPGIPDRLPFIEITPEERAMWFDVIEDLRLIIAGANLASFDPIFEMLSAPQHNRIVSPLRSICFLFH